MQVALAFRIPIGIDTATERNLSQSDPSRNKRPRPDPRMSRILLVDDSACFLHAASRVLRSHGYQVEAVIGPRLALDALGRERFDLVVSDVNMPELDGFALASAVRALGLRTPTILVSAEPEAGIEDRSVAAGAAAFVPKGAGMRLLCEAVEGILGRGAG